MLKWGDENVILEIKIEGNWAKIKKTKEINGISIVNVFKLLMFPYAFEKYSFYIFSIKKCFKKSKCKSR